MKPEINCPPVPNDRVPTEPVHVRWLIRRDLAEVLDIEFRSFAYPRQEQYFLRKLRENHCVGMVAERGEKVVGFMLYELSRNNLHLLSFAVHPEWRRKGVGAQLVAKLIGKLGRERSQISLNIRETNLDGQLFFRDVGFRAVKVVRSFFRNSDDAIRFEYRLEE